MFVRYRIHQAGPRLFLEEGPHGFAAAIAVACFVCATWAYLALHEEVELRYAARGSEIVMVDGRGPLRKVWKRVPLARVARAEAALDAWGPEGAPDQVWQLALNMRDGTRLLVLQETDDKAEIDHLVRHVAAFQKDPRAWQDRLQNQIDPGVGVMVWLGLYGLAWAYLGTWRLRTVVDAERRVVKVERGPLGFRHRRTVPFARVRAIVPDRLLGNRVRLRLDDGKKLLVYRDPWWPMPGMWKRVRMVRALLAQAFG